MDDIRLTTEEGEFLEGSLTGTNWRAVLLTLDMNQGRAKLAKNAMVAENMFTRSYEANQEVRVPASSRSRLTFCVTFLTLNNLFW